MKTLLTLSALSLGALVLTGCQDGARYEDPNGTRTVVSLDKVNIQDFAKAADDLTQSFLNSVAFARISANNTKTPVIAISSVRNDTSSQFDTDLLMQKIYSTLTNTGKVEVSSTIGGNRDALTRELQQQGDFAAGRDTIPATPEYTMTGKISEDRANAGSTKQTSYIFNLTVNNVRAGTIAWTSEVIVTKQGSKNSVGW